MVVFNKNLLQLQANININVNDTKHSYTFTYNHKQPDFSNIIFHKFDAALKPSVSSSFPL